MERKIAIISPSPIKVDFEHEFFQADKKIAWDPKEIEKSYDLILICGSLALKPFKLGVTFNEAKGCLIKQKFLVTVTPEEAKFKDKKKEALELSLRMFNKLRKGESVENKVKHTIVDSDDTISAMLFDIVKSPAISIDTETSGLTPFVPDRFMASIGIATENHAWTIPLEHQQSPWKGNYEKQKEIISKIKSFSKNCEIVGHNGKFDTIWINNCYGVWFKFTFDTMLAHYNLDENALHGLDVLAEKYLGVNQYDIPVSEKHGYGDLKSHCHYLAMDVRYTYDLYVVLDKLLDKDPLTRFVFENITMPASQCFARSENNGTYISPEALKESTEYWEQQLNEAKDKLKSYGDINWSSSKQVANFLFNTLKLPVLDKTPGGTPSCSESVLLRLSKEHEVPGLLLKSRRADKMLSTFLRPWKELIDMDGNSCIHPGFKVHGTVTGRPSSSDPNLQQVPREVSVRSVIQAPPGWTLIEGDLSQAELRIAAEMSQDPELRICYQTGIDVHARTVESIFGIERSQMTKEQRKKGKAINFGFIYGMGAKKFKEYARDNYGQDFTEEESMEIRKKYFRLYEALPVWHKRQRAFVHKKGYVRNLIGRKRRLPDALLDEITNEDRIKIAQAERNSINSPVQSLASDLNLSAFIALCNRFPDDNMMKPEGTIHDAIMVLARNEIAEEVCYWMKHYMEHSPVLEKLGVKLSIPIEAEVEVGSWGKGVIWKGKDL